MTPLLRKVGLGLTALVLICVGGVAILVSQVDADSIVADGVTQLEKISGHTVEVSPDAQVVYWPTPGVEISGLTVKTADGRQIVRASMAHLNVSYQALLQGQVTADSLRLISAEIELSMEDIDRVLEDPPAGSEWSGITSFSVQDSRLSIATDSDAVILENASIAVNYAGPSTPTTIAGVANWGAQTVEGEAVLNSLTELHRGELVPIVLSLRANEATAAFKGRVRLVGDAYPHVHGKGSVTATQPAALADLLDHRVPMLSALTNINSAIEITSQPNRLWLKARTTGTLNGRETALDTTLSANAGWMETSDFQLDIVNRTGGLYSAYFNGQLDRKGQISGVLKGAVLDLPGLIAWSEQDLQLDHARAMFTSDVTVAETGAALQSIELTLDDTPLRGSFAADLRGDKPIVSARIEAKGITIPDLFGDGPTATLRQYIANETEAIALDLSVEEVRVFGFPVQRLDATATQREDEIVIEISRLDVFGGTAVLDFIAPDDTASPLQGMFRAAEIDAAALTKAIDAPEVTGTLAGDASFSVQRLDGKYRLSSLSGDVTLAGGRTPIPDLTAALQNADPAPTTIVDLATGKIAYTGNELALDNVELSTRGQRWTGSVQIEADQKAIRGELSPTGAVDQNRLVTLQGPLDQIEISVQKRVGQNSNAETSGSNETPLTVIDPNAEITGSNTSPEASAPQASLEDDTNAVSPTADFQNGEQPLEEIVPPYTGPPAPETLSSPIPLRARR